MCVNCNGVDFASAFKNILLFKPVYGVIDSAKKISFVARESMGVRGLLHCLQEE